MDYQAIRELMKEMNSSSLTLVQIEDGVTKIRLEKQAAPAGFMMQDAMPQTQQTVPQNVISYVQPAPAVQKTDMSGSSEGTQKAVASLPEDSEDRLICSPMVGTFYLSASPDAPPLVKVGDRVKTGQTLCIIEAMKLMNEIESESDCEIAEVLVENEQMVEYGQPMFRIRCV